MLGWHARITLSAGRRDWRRLWLRRTHRRVVSGYITGWSTESDGRATLALDANLIEGLRVKGEA